MSAPDFAILASMLVSLLLAPVLLLAVDDDRVRLTAMAAASLLVVVISALFGPATEPRQLAAFYIRVRPPGWWPASATASGLSPADPLTDLRQRLLRVAACAFSATPG